MVQERENREQHDAMHTRSNKLGEGIGHKGLYIKNDVSRNRILSHMISVATFFQYTV